MGGCCASKVEIWEGDSPRTIRYREMLAAPRLSKLAPYTIEAAAAEAMADGFDVRQLTEADRKRVMFLYARGVYAEMQKERHVKFIKALLDPSCEESEVGRSHIDMLLTPDIVKSELPPGVQRFNKEAFAEYCDPASSFLVWRDLLGLSEPPHQRVQQQPSDHKLEAAVTLQRYLILLDRRKRGAEGDDDPGLVDSGAFAREAWALHHRPRRTVIEGEIIGPGIISLYHDLVTCGTSWERCGCNDTGKVERLLRQYGPALLYHFEVCSGFRFERGPFRGAAVEGASRPFQTMLVVGCRWEGSKLWLLLQCWWADKQFVEVDLDYVWILTRGIKGVFSFAKTPQTCVPAQYNVVHARAYGEGALISGRLAH